MRPFLHDTEILTFIVLFNLGIFNRFYDSLCAYSSMLLKMLKVHPGKKENVILVKKELLAFW